MAYFNVLDPVFSEKLRMIESTDRVHAEVFNKLFSTLIQNDVALMKAAGKFAQSKTEQAKFMLQLHKTGKMYGVHFNDYSVSPRSSGTRLYDAVGMQARPSTNTISGRNDFESESVFYGLEVNGYVDSSGEFVVEYIRGVDSEFTRTEKDTYILYLTQYVKIEMATTGENIILSDTQYEGFIPEGAAIRTDGTIRPFVAVAKYMMSTGSDGKPASLSGKNAEHNMSYNTMISRYQAKGTQYCGTTAQDVAHMQNLFMVAFATRNIQSVMTGCTYYHAQVQASVIESNVERIIIPTSKAQSFEIGSTVSIGNSNSVSGGNPNTDRGISGIHAKANRVRITNIGIYDDNNSVIYVNNEGVTFSTESMVLDGVSCPTIISTMPWRTGACDNVLGTCGSPTSNTDEKEPFILFGVEMFLGMYEIVGNVIMSIQNHTLVPNICYDCTKLATSITSDYVAVGYTVANTKGSWNHISKLGYDSNNPSVRHCIECNATSSTGYADGISTDNMAAASNGYREWLYGGHISSRDRAGLWCASLDHGLTDASWRYASRISASGRCGRIGR